jgi:hypothetical protein
MRYGAPDSLADRGRDFVVGQQFRPQDTHVVAGGLGISEAVESDRRDVRSAYNEFSFSA